MERRIRSAEEVIREEGRGEGGYGDGSTQGEGKEG